MSAAALERQIRPIYDALDTGSNKSAIVACNKVLKKHPNNDLVKALKSLALVRSQKVEESLVLCDEVLERKPTDDAVLNAMQLVLRGLGRYSDTTTMYEEAFKQQPNNEEWGAQTFLANVRAANWKSAQQVATRLWKTFQEERYLYWSVISAVLQANEPSTEPKMKTILYQLAHRLISTSPNPSHVHTDRFYLHLSILRELKLYEEANILLDSEPGKLICANSLYCDELRRAIWKDNDRLAQEAERAKGLILEKNERNWTEFISILDATFEHAPKDAEPSEEQKAEILTKVESSHTLFTQVAETDGTKDRSGLLALLELEKRARANKVSKDPSALINLLTRYFDNVGDKPCCFEDLKPYIALEGDDLQQWTSYLQKVPVSLDTVVACQRLINAHKLLRYNLKSEEVTVEAEKERVKTYISHYEQALALGVDLASTERQPADDLAILGANTYVNIWTLTKDQAYLQAAAALLEYALTRSKQSFFMRLILIRIYRIMGAPALGLEHYRALGIKQVQNDTLSHLLLSRSSTFSLAPTGDLTYLSECLEATQIYLSNSQETSEFIIRAFNAEKYSQIPEFLSFEEHLENSLQRDAVKLEYLRMRLSHEQLLTDLIDMELIELKFVFDRLHYDNREFEIIPDYQPAVCQSLHLQTLLFGKADGAGWLQVFLKTYIRAFQHASDLDDTVEEKLLIGDRPKQNGTFDRSLSLRDRLKQTDEAHFAELTDEEKRFVDFAKAIADWLEPYHDYARPPPDVVLAEAAKQTELKTGHPLKGIQLPPPEATNGSHKKTEDPPVVTEAPTSLVQYFEDARNRFTALKETGTVAEILHLANIIQEAYLFVVVETLRFNTPSVIKINKLGGLVPSIKTLKATGTAVLKTISAQLHQIAEVEGSGQRRKAVVSSCVGVPIKKIDQDFAFVLGKKITESRSKVLEGVSKSLTKTATTYGSTAA